MQLSKLQQEQIKKAALACYPEEMCGLLLEASFVQLDNKAADRLDNFTILAEDFLPYLGNIKAIVHSHTAKKRRPTHEDIRTPSVEDVKAQQLVQLPFLIVGTDGENVTEPLQYPKEPSNVYIGRPFIWFVNDCYSLVQDYYLFEKNIKLPPHKAERNFTDIREQDNIFADHIESYGFRSETFDISLLENGTLLLLDGILGRQNHLGIYHEGQVLHQLSLSVQQPLEHFLRRIHALLIYDN